MSKEEALGRARKLDLDLVEVLYLFLVSVFHLILSENRPPLGFGSALLTAWASHCSTLLFWQSVC